jgi:hypothetical protein
MKGDLFYGLGDGAFRTGFALRFGEVEAGDLEAVEEEAGPAWVDVVGGDALEDLADGKLNAGAIVGIGEGEAEAGAASITGVGAGAGVGGRFAGGVVVEAEIFSAQAGAAAAVAVGEDVAALEASGWFGLRCLGLRLDGVVHWSLPQGYFLVQSLRKKRVKSGLPGPGFPFLS